MPNITMNYGAYNFSPVPLVTVEKKYYKRGDGEIIGTAKVLNLEGFLVTTSGGIGGGAGLTTLSTLQNDLEDAFHYQGDVFVIQCGPAILFSGYPTFISNLAFGRSTNNWVFSIPYNVSMEFTEDYMHPDGVYQPDYVADYRDSWTLEIADNPTQHTWTIGTGIYDEIISPLRLTHTVSAIGRDSYDSSGNLREAWIYARSYVTDRLSYTTGDYRGEEVFNFNVSKYFPCNHVRVQNIDKPAGSFAVTESWVVLPSGSGYIGNAIEDFNISVKRSSESDLFTIGINGSIEGCQDAHLALAHTGDYFVHSTKYSNASGYFAVLENQNRLYYRAKAIADSYTLTRGLNPSAASQTVAHNPTRGIISYDREFNNRPTTCITGALYENIEITDNNPADVFASLTILGRARGPILQAIGTITAPSKAVSIDLVWPITSGCGYLTLINSSPKYSGVDTFIASIYSSLTSLYPQVFVNSDRESWNPKTGRYSRQVEWTYSTGC